MKVALITGAAQGIGASMAWTFAESGYAVAVVDIEHEAAEDLTVELTAAGCESAAFITDLSDLDQLRPLADAVFRRFGSIDVLVNNAATRDLTPIHQTTPQLWTEVITVNLTAPALLSQAVVPFMIDGGGGVILNITSVEATIPKGVSAAYAAAKGGLISLTFDSAAVLAGKGIRVVALSPGAVDTRMGGGFDTSPSGADASLDRDIKTASEELIPMKRWATPGEIASVALWLASDAASYITGTEIVVDGGLMHTWMPRSLKNRIAPGEFE